MCIFIYSGSGKKCFRQSFNICHNALGIRCRHNTVEQTPGRGNGGFLSGKGSGII